MDYGCARGLGVVCLKAQRCQMKRPGPFSTCHRNSAPITPSQPTREGGGGEGPGGNFDQWRRIRRRHALLPPLYFPSPLPQVMYYECCLITQPRILHTGWHIYLFVLYLFASRLYAKPFCDGLVYSLAPPRRHQTNRQIEEGRRAIDGQSSGRCSGTPRLPHSPPIWSKTHF